MRISEIIEALEKAHEPNRWLDAKIDAVLRVGTHKMRSGGYEWAWDNFPVWAHHKQARGMCGVLHTNGDLGLIWDSLEFTSSLDVAFMLVDRALPGWRIFIEATNGIADDLYILGPVYRDDYPERESSPPIAGKPVAMALVLATVKAIQAKEPTP